MIPSLRTPHGRFVYRSRLEAKWSIVFDHFRTVYTYEPQRFELHGMRYTPDFWLPKHRAFVEIKGQPIRAKQRQKLQLLARRRGVPGYIFTGPPQSAIHGVAVSGEFKTARPIELAECKGCGGLGFLWPDGVLHCPGGVGVHAGGWAYSPKLRLAFALAGAAQLGGAQ